MSNPTETNALLKRSTEGLQWYDSKEDAKADGWGLVPCSNILQFFMLRGKTVNFTKDNIVPIPDMHFLVYAKAQERYYFREYHGWDLDQAYFYRPTLTFSGEDPSIENLRMYISDGNVTLLFNKGQSSLMTDVLKRVYKDYYKKEGKVPYDKYMQLMKLGLDYEDYQTYSKSLTGYRTVCRQFEERIGEVWKSVGERLK